MAAETTVSRQVCWVWRGVACQVCRAASAAARAVRTAARVAARAERCADRHLTCHVLVSGTSDQPLSPPHTCVGDT
ncbi:hypothetical protein PQR15_15375 [Streptomyces lydicus]|nr:hypothetical protein [Streptomyces lydicus]